MEEAFDPWRLSDMPAWVGDIGLVVTCTRFDVGMLERLAELVDPTKTLIYLTLTEWRANHPYNYPDYTPREDLGGFMETAHRLGFRVMLHASLHDISPTDPLYPEFEIYQYRHPYNGKLMGWRWEEIDNPNRYAHINPASSRWRNLLIQQWKAVWEKYKVDAFLLDTSHFVINNANGLIEGLTGAQGNVLMHKELVEAMPNKSHGVQIAIELLQHYLSTADQNVRETKLLPNYPNPFNPDTWIPYQLSESASVTVRIYDIRGHLVRTIEVGHKPVGYYLTHQRAVYWNGCNRNGEPVSSGVYFYTLNTDTYTQTRRMVIVK